MKIFCKVGQDQNIWAWIFRLFCLAGLFSLLFIDAYFNIQRRNNDYEIGRLGARRRALEDELTQQNSLLSQVKPKEFMEKKAEELGLQNPDVYQFQVVQYREVPRKAPILRLDNLQRPLEGLNPPVKRIEMANRPELEAAPAIPVQTVPAVEAVELKTVPAPAEVEDPELSFMSVGDMLASL
ncbi:MAG TPA: hypothetical protein PLZ53_05890 [Candidatus Hydrogenedentes bacterium]|mgnify:FL=1|jgi:hypothetical protein|nr:MAG: hypothetical protein BWY07_00151 [Candidatus Hydrogenedentes bacterium ADurb.Bin170]HNZ48815.1 hypothetical protein [Candidatus Hydrogenedentota bacterium]HOD94803.1 hypothetical protein [Candidatus Hydrogenedentota bacterium]HOH42628.1 hypothetical protein [Candidatus Hydrogenedentota bacterium]HOM49169.1 hypothetical protein [Candidatus Hydrogenedentota bacterium]